MEVKEKKTLTLIELSEYLPSQPPGFCEWLEDRLSEAALPFTPKRMYKTSEVFVDLLGASQNLYQYWEKNPDSGYPVPNPFKVSGAGGWATDPQRLYTLKQAVEIARWYWGKYVEGLAPENEGKEDGEAKDD